MDAPQRWGFRGRTARLRFTVLYAVLFLVSAIGLLTLTNLLAGAGMNQTQPVPGQNPPTQQLSLAQERIQQLESQLADSHAAQARQLLTGSVIALAVMVLVSVMLGRVVAGRVLRPLRTITATTRRISAANLHQRLAVAGPADEVKQLADTIDDLLERLEASFAAQRRFVANASHELRTPLATMRASLDVAAAKPQPSAQTLSLADRLRVELDRVDALLDGLLVLARAQHGVPPDDASVSLRDLVGAALTARAADITAKELTLDERGLHEVAPVQGSATLLGRMVDNVIDNAVVHNHHGGWIRVATSNTTDEPGGVQLVVETGGAVLDPEHVDRLAQPFQRLAADRTGSDRGAGLGLSIVAAITQAHGGGLRLQARSEGGLRVAVSLPRVAAPHEVLA